jgi:hypothetical protein
MPEGAHRTGTGRPTDRRHAGQDVTALDTAGSLLETKLYLPRPRSGLVVRRRLSERLSRAFESKLTLVSAPAGFGKTTLLTGWLAAMPADGRSAAWLSLDQGDDRRDWCGSLQPACPSPGPEPDGRVADCSDGRP